MKGTQFISNPLPAEAVLPLDRGEKPSYTNFKFKIIYELQIFPRLHSFKRRGVLVYTGRGGGFIIYNKKPGLPELLKL